MLTRNGSVSSQPKRQLSWIKSLSIAVAVSPIGRWLVPHVLSRLDLWLSHASGGRFSATRLLGFPMLILTTIGRVSGQTRETPLIYFRNEDQVVVVASSLGSRDHPQWYRNLLHSPYAAIFMEGQRGDYTYRLLQGLEREVYWQRMLDIYPGYDRYAELADGREIPVILFTRLN